MMKNANQVPKQVWEDLEYEIARRELEYADNFRAYRYIDQYLYKEYMESKNKGCCGEYESSTRVNGQQWIIGCNYGH
jgi:hypothetical protein